MVSASKLPGKKVVGANGRIVGEVEGVDLDTNTWQVAGLQVGLTNEAAAEAGFKRPVLSQIVVIVPTKLISAVGEVINLSEPVANLKDLVKYLGFRG